MARVLVDLLFFTGKRGGTETVVRELYSRLGDEHDLEYVGFASKELAAAGAPWFPGRLVDSGLSTDNRGHWLWGELFAVSRAARREGVDVIHAPANFGPALAPVPVVLTLHDVLAFKRPEFLPSRLTVLPTKLLIRGAARNAARIVTVSEDARKDIHDILGLPLERISVAYPGSSGAAPSEGGSRSSERIFSLGNRMKHKNFPRLIEALSLIPAERRPVLTISGSHGDDPLRADVERFGLQEWVDLRSWLERDEVEDLYRSSAAVVFPTLFEGFGLPVLEAMERGCPVLCSDIPVLREVGGDAVVFFDPTDPAAIARTIESSLADRALLDEKRRQGYEQATIFSWPSHAEHMATTLREAAHLPR